MGYRIFIIALFLTSCAPALEPQLRYSRSDWGSWIDKDGDKLNTRQEVLIQESRTPPKLDSKYRKVITGLWECPYTGEKFRSPRKLDIDHMVPLKNAWESGGKFWSKEKMVRYYNDTENPEHLIATSASANRSKGSKGPDKWKPKNKDYWCQYANDWFRIKERWDLWLKAEEARAACVMLLTCEE